MQYLTLWDRIGGSFRAPSAFEGAGPLDVVMAMNGDGGVACSGAVGGDNGRGGAKAMPVLDDAKKSA